MNLTDLPYEILDMIILNCRKEARKCCELFFEIASSPRQQATSFLKLWSAPKERFISKKIAH